MFCERKKKSKCPKKNFKVWKGGECKCKISGVRKKRKLKEKFRGKKSKCFWVKVKVKDFAKFVFTSWAVYCETWQKKEI